MKTKQAQAEKRPVHSLISVSEYYICVSTSPVANALVEMVGHTFMSRCIRQEIFSSEVDEPMTSSVNIR
jgi:hypothetical protein